MTGTFETGTKVDIPACPDACIIQWRDAGGRDLSEVASPALLHESFADALPLRAGVQYQNRLNRHSRQFFSPQGSHVWCESALEAEALLVLAFEGRVRRIAAQPMVIIFSDGTRHYPDFFALHGNGDQFVYDVKPSGRMNDTAATQFAKTADVCARIGWHHEVLHEAHPTKVRNLEWLRSARHPRYHPEQCGFEHIRTVFEDARTFRDGAVMVNLRHPYVASANIRHLLWHRHLDTDFNEIITAETVLRTTPKGGTCNCGG